MRSRASLAWLEQARMGACRQTALYCSFIVGLTALLAFADTATSSSHLTLTRNVPAFVKRVCEENAPNSPVLFICPPLVPVSRYQTHAGLFGTLFATQNIPPPKGRQRLLYLISFNNGFGGPVYYHWIAGIGSSEAIQRWVLSDASNVLKGKPKRLPSRTIANRPVTIWKFPEYPAGGMFGGHVLAITPACRLYAFASVHGNTPNESARMAVALAERSVASCRPR